MAKEVTKAPTGLKIARDGNKFTASWKIGDSDYGDGQFFQYLINDTGKDKWQPTKDTGIGEKVTSKVVKIDKKDFFPNKTSKGVYKPYLYEIGVRVKGNRKKYTTGSGKKKKEHSPSVSSWTEKRFKVNKPKNPSVVAALDEELTNVCKFTWSAPYDDKDSYIFTDVQWQTILVKNSKETNGSKLNWKSAQEGSVSSTGSKEITEDTAILYKNGDSYTRWFRVRARGPAGCSDWRYAYHVYALSHQANVTGTSADETDEGGFQCTVDWEATSNRQNPIDKATVQYTITIPDEDLTCPSGVSWNDANISRDTSAGDAAVFSIDDQLAKDQCLFIRVNTQHDGQVTHGKPQLSRVGFLKDPSGLAVATDNVTHKATITATNNSEVEDSVLVVRYVPSDDNPIDVGVIPKGSSSVTVQCPNWDDQSAIAFDVYAMVGTATKQVRADGVDSYSIEARMRSQNTVSQGGAVPVAPQNVSVNRVEGKPDTVRVTWDWPWNDAGSAEITWSDHDDAWESTDEPESFTISNLHASAWNISGLETGKTWYVRVRLIAGNLSDSEDVTYGPWSDIVQGTIDLSSAPNKPVLVLSDATIPEDGSTTASWVYTTTDNTGQAYAEVAVVEDGEYTPIAHALTAQHTTIDAISAGFTVGNIYNLSCRVKSVSGKISEWSDIVSVTVAEPLTCEITETSLETQSIEVNPESHSGNPITIYNPDGVLEFAKLQVNIEPTQEGTGDPSPTNVRSIHGVGEVEFEDVGKNLIYKVENAYISPTTNYAVYQDGANQRSLFFKCEKGVSYTVSGVTIDRFVYGVFDDEPLVGTQTTVFQNLWNGNQLPKTITPSKSGVCVVYLSNQPVDTNKAQIEKGPTATAYEPYQEPISIQQPLTTTLQPIASDDEPYLMRAMPYSDATNLTESLIGGTVAWNQLASTKKLSFATNNTADKTFGTANLVKNRKYLMLYKQSATLTSNERNTPLIVNTTDGTKRMTQFSSSNANLQGGIKSWLFELSVDSGEYSLKYWCHTPNVAVDIDDIVFFDLTAMFNPQVADAIYAMEQATAGAGVAWFRKLFNKSYYPYNKGELMSVKTSAHVTTGFNQWDEEWEAGYYRISDGTKVGVSGLRNKNPISVFPNTVYYAQFPSGSSMNGILFYDADKNYLGSSYAIGKANSGTFTTPSEAHFMNFQMANYSTTYKNDICINLSDPSLNGTYKPSYVHSYPLPNTELRGVAKWVDGKLQYDGDILEPSGRVTRKYERVDLGSLTWTMRTDVGAGVFSGLLDKYKPAAAGTTIPTSICSKYPFYQFVGAAVGAMANDKTYSLYYAGGYIYVYDTSYTDIASFKSAMSGVYLVYEKATPTTETVASFESNQVSDGGTESYTDARTVAIPVGHKSIYKTSHVYGGYVDLITGELVVEKVAFGGDAIEWRKNTFTFGSFYYYSTDLKAKYLGYFETVWCSCYPSTYNAKVTAGDDNYIWVRSDSAQSIYIKDSSKESMTVEQFAEYMKGQQIVYELATPIRTTLSSRELSALVGRNTLTANGNMQIRLAEGITETECLTRLPLTVTVEGAGEGIAASIEVERAEDYSLNRPDEDTFQGHQGETVLKTPRLFGIDQVSFTTDDVIGSLDDGATYNIVATVQDGLGQTAQAVLPFTVHWSHQAEKPSATVIIDEEELVAFITPIAPENAEPDDVADIYRLSADKPELIVRGAEFGETYVDPFPALGDMGGHRIVTRTRNGDYITADNEIAMVDSPELGVNPIENEDLLNIIDFEGRQIRFYWETNYSNTWAKDFKETQYLGGAIEGDWNAAVSRSGTLSSKAITVLDQEMLKDVRRLADYPGICHVRTADGSSYAADVQVSEDYTDDEKGMVVNYSLSITRIGPERLDGMTLEQWEDENPTGEEEE